jgi:hypothetical protein
LPHEAAEPPADPRVAMRPLDPPLWRSLGIAHRAEEVEQATRYVLDVLWGMGQEEAVDVSVSQASSSGAGKGVANR